MLNVFVGSTFRDLKDERGQLLENLDEALTGVGMEKFIPDGRASQEVGIGNLRDSDIAIFLISPYYGSLIEKCKIGDCNPNCPMVKDNSKISYTHCEYKVAIFEDKPHQVYIVDRGWDDPAVSDNALKFKKEVDKQFCPRIFDVEGITGHLAHNIAKWYSEDKVINLSDFCGRRDELEDLLKKMGEPEPIEVYGVGGIGKTTLIHVALLIKKLEGKKIITLGASQSYVTGSGYIHFMEKCKDSQNEIIGDTIGLSDIMDALSVPEGLRIRLKDKDEQIRALSAMIEEDGIILFIDDFHLADRDVKELVKMTRGVVVLASKTKVDVSRKEVPLFGVKNYERDELIDHLEKKFLGSKISSEARKKIKEIAEGHPVSTEILVGNYQKIDFKELEDYKQGLNLSKPDHTREFILRVIEDILSEEALDLLKNLSLINTELKNNLHGKTIEKTFEKANEKSNKEIHEKANEKYDFNKIFSELIDAGMLEKKRGEEDEAEDKEGIYQYTYHHIKEAIADESNKKAQRWAVLYYNNKKDAFGKCNDDLVEVLFHRSISDPGAELISDFLQLKEELKPVHYGHKRLIDVGEILKTHFKEEYKAPILGTLANLYSNLRRFTEAEGAYKEALEIYKKLAEKSPDAYLPDVATTQNNLGILYIETERTYKGISILKGVLNKRGILQDLGAGGFSVLGMGYEKLRKRKEAARSYLSSSAAYFFLFTKGVDCSDMVMGNLAKTAELSDGEAMGDALMMLIVMSRITGRKDVEELGIPEGIPLSKRGRALKEAFSGKKVDFDPDPKDEIDMMVLGMVEALLS